MENENTIWYAVSVEAASTAAEALEFAFNELDALGTEINHLRKNKADAITVVGYFQELPDEDVAKTALENAVQIYGLAADSIHDIQRYEVAKTDWLAEWKKHWKPTITDKFIIAPPWEDVTDEERTVIRIEPNMAFGTGTHETTKLCIKAIEEQFDAAQTFLDVGTGTGILAIAAAKMIAASGFEATENLLACDTDVDSVKIAKENAELNGVGGQIDFYIGSIDADTPQFDFVCANLTIDVIVPILSLLISKTKNTLVLSGILIEQEDLLSSELQKFQIAEYAADYDGEWMSAVIKITA